MLIGLAPEFILHQHFSFYFSLTSVLHICHSNSLNSSAHCCLCLGPLMFTGWNMSYFVYIKLADSVHTVSEGGYFCFCLWACECISMLAYKLICTRSPLGVPLLSSVSACNKEAYCCVWAPGLSWAPLSLACLSAFTHKALIYKKEVSLL